MRRRPPFNQETFGSRYAEGRARREDRHRLERHNELLMAIDSAEYSDTGDDDDEWDRD